MIDSQRERKRGAQACAVTAAAFGAPRFALRSGADGTTRTIGAIGARDLPVAGELGGVLDDALAECERVPVDHSAAEFIDSAGVHVLLRAHRRAAERSIGLSIVPACEPVQRVFGLCGVDAILPFVSAAPGAANRLRPSGGA